MYLFQPVHDLQRAVMAVQPEPQVVNLQKDFCSLASPDLAVWATVH